MHTDLQSDTSMRVINVKAFIEREQIMSWGGQVDRRRNVFKFLEDEAIVYAILSHRWVERTEVKYEEIDELARMTKEDSDEVRRRPGYKKILNSCRQAQSDGYEWLWVDTCCIDKRSSAELSEAINSMYRWYESSGVCYAYLDDVFGSALNMSHTEGKGGHLTPTGWPDWFSRGWTLQEMIAPSNVQFFNRHWQCVGDKKLHATTLASITGVPRHILTDGLSSHRPCVAQIMSWAANRTTKRVEDRAYSLMGLLDVNMPLLYGEGKKAFHRLQLEVIQTSNDHSVFAWAYTSKNRRTDSILADDPSFFRGCDEMVLMDAHEFIEHLKGRIRQGELRSIDEDHFGTFPVTNRGIQIWLPLTPYVGSRSVFQAWLPCRLFPSAPPVAIKLALWKSNYYRYPGSLYGGIPVEQTFQVRQVYLRYQYTPHRDATFEIDDIATTGNSFTYCGTYPLSTTGNTLTLTITNPFRISVYSDNRAKCRFAVGFGHSFGQDWIHLICEEPASTHNDSSWEDYARKEYEQMLVRGPEHARSMFEARSRGGCGRLGRVCIIQTQLLQSIWTVQTSCTVWENTRSCGVRIEVFQRYPGFGNVLSRWRGFDVEVGGLCTTISLMLIPP